MTNNLSLGDALRAAWLNAKIETLNAKIDAMSYIDRFTAGERAVFHSMNEARNALMTQFRFFFRSAAEIERDELKKLKAQMQVREVRADGSMLMDTTIYLMTLDEFKEYLIRKELAA